MSHCGLKSRRLCLPLDEEDGKCSIVMCCAEFGSEGVLALERVGKFSTITPIG